MKNSSRFIAALGLCAALSLSAVTAFTVRAQGGGRIGGDHRGDGIGGQSNGRGMERMAQALGLSESQKSKIMAIVTAQRPQMQALFQNKSLTREQRTTKMRAVSGENMKKINAILTPAQRQKVATMMSQKRDQMQRGR